jgi:hypothetical protein
VAILMTNLVRPNIYELLKSEFKVFDVLIDIGCAGDCPLYDLVDFDWIYRSN